MAIVESGPDARPRTDRERTVFAGAALSPLAEPAPVTVSSGQTYRLSSGTNVGEITVRSGGALVYDGGAAIGAHLLSRNVMN